MVSRPILRANCTHSLMPSIYRPRPRPSCPFGRWRDVPANMVLRSQSSRFVAASPYKSPLKTYTWLTLQQMAWPSSCRQWSITSWVVLFGAAMVLEWRNGPQPADDNVLYVVTVRLRMVSIITNDSVTHRTASQFYRYAADTGTCGLAEKYNTVLIACGTPAARRWLPQAIALSTFFDVFVARKMLAVRCITESLCKIR